MCRLFGFRSNNASHVHQSLVREANSLRVQSREHKDGWGIASYGDGELPHAARGLGPAHADPEFERVSALVASHAVVAHVRLASVGPVRVENAHPFVYGAWTFAHNGTLQRFEEHCREIEMRIDPDLRALLRGDTDSERCFFLFLTELRRTGSLQNRAVDDVALALAQTAREVVRITEPGATKPSSTNFLVTDGKLMICTRRHRTLFYSERKKRQDRDPHEAPQDGERLQQIVIASEQLESETHWFEAAEETVIGVDGDLVFRQWTFDELAAR